MGGCSDFRSLRTIATGEELPLPLKPTEQFEKRYSVGVIKGTPTLKTCVISAIMFKPNDTPRKVYRESNVGQFHSLEDWENMSSDSLACDKEHSIYFIFYTITAKSKFQESNRETQSSCEREAELFLVRNPSFSPEEK